MVGLQIQFGVNVPTYFSVNQSVNRAADQLKGIVAGLDPRMSSGKCWVACWSSPRLS